MKSTARLFSMMLFAGAAYSGNIVICSTGDGAASGSSCGSQITSPAFNNLTADGNWYVAGNSSGTFLSQAFVTINGSSPVNPGFQWLANDANSMWLMPSNNQSSVLTNGQFYLSTQFQVAPGTQTNAQIAGLWLADDYGTGVYLNGVAISQAALPQFGGEGGSMVAFSVTSANATFTSGNNVLTFGFLNDSTNHGLLTGGTTPTGLRVQITSATSGPSVPEPGTLGAMLGGLLLMVIGAKAKIR